MLGIGLAARRLGRLLLRAAIRRLLQCAAGGLAQWPLGRGVGHVGVEDGACRRASGRRRQARGWDVRSQGGSLEAWCAFPQIDDRTRDARRCGRIGPGTAMNHLKTFALLAAMTALFMGLGYLIGGATGNGRRPAVRGRDESVQLLERRQDRAEDVSRPAGRRAAPQRRGQELCRRRAPDGPRTPACLNPRSPSFRTTSPTPSPPAATPRTPPSAPPPACSTC